MAANKCDKCGARFDVKGAVGTLDQHMASFHPGAASKAQLERAAAAPAPVSTGQVIPAAEPSTAPATDKALAKMTTAELEATAAAEGVDLDAASTNAERVELIEAHRSDAT